jgi:hypothetical protein
MSEENSQNLSSQRIKKILIPVVKSEYDDKIISYAIILATVIKTTSYPLGFTANNTGTIQLLTNIPIAVARNITTETFLTDLNKTNILSNPVKTLPTISPLIKSSEFTPTIINNKT